MLVLEILYVGFLLLMLGQGGVSIFLALYAWEDPERIKRTQSPTDYLPPRMSFTVLLPARHEKLVIGETIRRLSAAHYPSDLVEILLVCDEGDYETIAAAKHIISQRNISNAKIVTFGDRPINKPHGLNTGLRIAEGDLTVIFDAEDNVHPDIFNIANTMFQETGADILQAGTQLMDYDSHWFSSHNVLEYYFWFRSRMHYHTAVGVVPLGGNTVFFKTEQLRNFGGWNEACLTEDAEIGIRMSTAGKRIFATYDPQHVTKEETPATLSQFIKQRTRWNQGFIQVLRAKKWQKYNTRFKRAFCWYTLSFPFVQAILFVVTPLAIYVGLTAHMPILVTMLSLLPILVVVLQVVINVVGLYEFTGEQQLKRKWRIFPLMIFTFPFYQLLLSIGAIRATYRELRGQNNWEKTAHSGVHREIVAGEGL